MIQSATVARVLALLSVVVAIGTTIYGHPTHGHGDSVTVTVTP